ncbi:MAG: hypothetical protein AB7F86_12490 [Bdellovibrionales bacterium]
MTQILTKSVWRMTCSTWTLRGLFMLWIGMSGTGTSAWAQGLTASPADAENFQEQPMRGPASVKSSRKARVSPSGKRAPTTPGRSPSSTTADKSTTGTSNDANNATGGSPASENTSRAAAGTPAGPPTPANAANATAGITDISKIPYPARPLSPELVDNLLEADSTFPGCERCNVHSTLRSQSLVQWARQVLRMAMDNPGIPKELRHNQTSDPTQSESSK